MQLPFSDSGQFPLEKGKSGAATVLFNLKDNHPMCIDGMCVI